MDEQLIRRTQFLNVFHTGEPNIYAVRFLFHPLEGRRELLDAIIDMGHEPEPSIGIWKVTNSGVSTPNFSHSDVILAKFLRLHGGQVDPAPFSFLKIDIVGHSRISVEHVSRAVNKALDDFYYFVEHQVIEARGEVKSWQGDGGLCLFAGSGREEDATQCAFSILKGLEAFNAESELEEELMVRIAVHSGAARLRSHTGLIHSQDINWVAHAEGDVTAPSSVTISRDTYSELSQKLRGDFDEWPEPYEGRLVYTSAGLENLKAYLDEHRPSYDHLEAEVSRLRSELERLRKRGIGAGNPEDEAFRALSAELSENIGIVARGSGPGTPFRRDSWDTHKSIVASLPIREALEDVYRQMDEHNQRLQMAVAAENSTIANQHFESARKLREPLKETLPGALRELEQYTGAPEPWVGVPWKSGTFLALSGPLQGIDTKGEVPAEPEMLELLRKEGIGTGITPPNNMASPGKGRIIYLTDRKTWKQTLIGPGGTYTGKRPQS